MPLADGLAPVLKQLQALKKAAHPLSFDRACEWSGLFITGQVRGRSLSSQPMPSPRMERFDPQFLGAVVTLVEVLGHPLEASTVAWCLPPAGPVIGDPKKRANGVAGEEITCGNW